MSGRWRVNLFFLNDHLIFLIFASEKVYFLMNLFLSDGEVAGQEVGHSHLQIAPRFSGDGQHVGFNHGDPDANPRSELDRVAKEISKLLTSLV